MKIKILKNRVALHCPPLLGGGALLSQLHIAHMSEKAKARNGKTCFRPPSWGALLPENSCLPCDAPPSWGGACFLFFTVHI